MLRNDYPRFCIIAVAMHAKYLGVQAAGPAGDNGQWTDLALDTMRAETWRRHLSKMDETVVELAAQAVIEIHLYTSGVVPIVTRVKLLARTRRP